MGDQNLWRFLASIVCISFSVGYVNSSSQLSASPAMGHHMNATGCHFEAVLKARGGLDGYRLICVENDTLDHVPIGSARASSSIIAIVIKNQPRLRYLRKSDMGLYKRLRKFTLTDSGLRWVERETFIRSKDLERVDLRGNALRTLDWRSMVGLPKATLDVRQNPFVCNCSIYWLAVWNKKVAKRREIQSPDGSQFELSAAFLLTLPSEIVGVDELECASTLGGHTANTTVRDWAFANEDADEETCAVPDVRMHPKEISTIEGNSDAVQFSCSIRSAQPLDDTFRETIQLRIVDANDTPSLIHLDRRYEHDGMTVNISTYNATRGLMGWYMCIGASESGPQFDLASLSVESKPQVRLWGNDLITSEVGQITEAFEFFIVAHPPVTQYTWLKNGVPFDIQEERIAAVVAMKREDETTRRKKPFFYAERLYLTIQMIFAFSFYEGDYELRACNSYGCDQLPFVSYRNASWFPNHPPQLESPIVLTVEREQAPAGTSEIFWIVAVSCTSCGLLLCGIGFAYRWIRGAKILGRGQRGCRQALHARDFEDGQSLQLFSYTSNPVYEPLLSTSVPVVPMASLEIVETLGEGAFGEVYLAYCHLSKRSGDESEKPTAVAAKRLKQFASTECSQDFIREAEFMAKLNHPNIVTFYGVCLRGREDLLLLYEYMDLGDLKRFLALHGPHPELMNAPADTWRLTPLHQIDIARQVAQGLAYLHRSHFVHRDLASRNCLISTGLVVKLSDFGMSRDIYSSDYYRLTHKAPLPVRWLPPEALCYGRFSDMSDVWSYGVVVWEIASFGEQPWRGLSNFDVMQKVGAGETLTPPDDCPRVLREVMLECWRRAPCERVKLDEVITRLTMCSSQPV